MKEILMIFPKDGVPYEADAWPRANTLALGSVIKDCTYNYRKPDWHILKRANKEPHMGSRVWASVPRKSVPKAIQLMDLLL